jgi:biotin carboxyl carrier protein
MIELELVLLFLSMYNATVNQTKLEITHEDGVITINGNPLQWDKVVISENRFHILYKDKSFTAEVVKADASTKSFSFKINGRIYTVSVKDKFDTLLEKMGLNAGSAGKVNSLKAPMPGLIIDLKVKAGDTVKAGDALLILEAMKMENILKAPGEAVIKKVNVQKGNSVEKGQVLIEF